MSLEWLKKAKMISWWLTWEDLEWPSTTLEQKWKNRAKTFSKQGANTVVMFGFHFRWNYVSIIDRVFGVLSRISDICHNEGLRVVEHHSANLIHMVRNVHDRWNIYHKNHHHVPFYTDNWDSLSFNGHPLYEWQQISAGNNQPVYFEGYNAAIMCPNNPGYQKAYLQLMEKHIERVKIDALMSDDLHFLPDIYSCCCVHCQKRFIEEAGVNLPPVSDQNFWENRKNPDFQKWISLRYKWNTEHYMRLRNFLPKEIALTGCSSSAITHTNADMGFSTQDFAIHWDVVFHEINHTLQLNKNKNTDYLLSTIAAAASVAKHLHKPFWAICYVNRPEDLEGWLDLLKANGARPWVCKQVRTEDSAPSVSEEKLITNGYNFPDQLVEDETRPVAGILFSQKYRDELSKKEAGQYVQNYIDICYKLLQQKYRVEVVFDQFRSLADTSKFDKLWSINEKTAAQVQNNRTQ